MSVDPADPRWRKILTTESDIAAASLATRILIARLRREVVRVPTSLNEKVTELLDFLRKSPMGAADAARL